MKFSIVIPVYNVEKYIDKCLTSIINQTYDNFEVIVVNDGSPDNSQVIIDKYVKKDKRFKSYEKKNGGLSDARNYGLEYISGDYLLFIDSDDNIEKDLLLKLSKKVKKNNFEVVRFSLNVVDEDGNKLKNVDSVVSNSNDKTEIIEEIIKNDYVEPAWLYCYKTSFFLENNFLYPIGKIHEDFGLTLIILSRAKNIGVISYCGYNYVQRENSIMSNTNYEKIKKRVSDFVEHHINNKKKLGNSYIDKLLLSYSASCTITKICELNVEDLSSYITIFKKNKIVDDIIGNSIIRRLKKIYLKLFLKTYVLSLKKRCIK